jgi:hypothetical protein
VEVASSILAAPTKLKIKKMILRCANPNCPTKKFTPPNRRYSQQVCSRYECHIYLERKKKREWWRKHGNAWRKKRKFRRASLDEL